ncbi:PAS domain S-box protein [Roseateles saccharophilus]|uniref:histidine kinase n=1 Tax=Roseateles saccharophilus TaxID=304 RepID=A0A4R3V646_ROSSA|nr:PAS domain S-box protein [Roseateles saccharophilus]MDG0833738.1 PAS domain S-box protein [Roseateles saccharophilus]TCU98818.1 PAS domain S-box-containing protein [Roseateles saccharophilus]
MKQASPVSVRGVGRYLVLSAGITLVYYLLGRLGLLMVLPPYHVAPIYPAAGWGLAVLLVLGLRHLPAVALGSAIVQATAMADMGASALLLAAGIGCGAAAQAAAGTLLVRRWCGRPPLLTSPREIGGYLAAAALAGLVSPSCATLVLKTLGVITAAQMPLVWTIWWTGDLMGVLIATPITLALIGQPRSAWAPRRFSVGLPMLLTTLLVGLGVAVTVDWDRQRNRADFAREANGAAQDLAGRLREPLLALEGVHGLIKVKPLPTREEFARATSAFLGEDTPLLALGLTLRVARADVDRFNAAAAADNFPGGYQARDRNRAGDLQVPADEDMMAIRLIEPLSRNLGALGINVRTIPGARAAIAQAAALGRPVASAGFQLSQDKEGAVGVVVYQPLYRRNAVPGEQALDGVVFATLRPDLLMSHLAAGWPEQLGVCLVDLGPDATYRRLGGRPGCEAVQRGEGADLPLVKMPLEFGGRHWEVHVYDLPGLVQEPGRSWAFALVGLMSTAMVGALLLLMSGRTQHVEAQVRERTAALEREIGNRTLGEQALRQSEERFRSIFETAPIGIAFTDLNGGFQEVNSHFCKLVGYPAESLMGRRSIDVTHEDDRREDIRLANRMLRGEIPFYRRNKRYVRPDGSIAHARVLVSLLRGPDGRPHRLVGVVEDITDQLRMEELDRAREAAEAANQAKNDFLSRMSHELRTPMNAILGFTQLMQMDAAEPLAPAQRGRAQQIAQAGWHLLEMINDTLDLSRIEAGSLRLEPAVLELPPLLARALALVQHSATERGLALSQRIDPGAVQLQGDPTRVTQILTNLLSNAVKYNRPGGSISIQASAPEPGWVEVAVRDTGLGLSEAQRAALFQPFNRLGREHSGLPGTGIGLVISLRLAEMMGGSLRAEAPAPGQGQGACFVLRLPAAGAATPAALEGRPDEPAAPRAGPHRRLLYIEDNPLNAEVMRGILEQRPGLELEVATTVEAGVRALRERPPALLLLDWQLPDGDGQTVLGRLRELGHTAPPVVVVSANAQPEQIALARTAGARHYLTKPLDVRELLALVDELLAGPAASERAE